MKIAIIGLGKMGAQIAQRWVEAGHQVIALDPDETARQVATEFGAISASSRQQVIDNFGREQIALWLMIPAQLVTDEVNAWIEILPSGSLIIDGGNTDFRNTKKHAQLAAKSQLEFVDVGVSGGVLGTTNGFSMMVGGNEASYKQIKPLLEALAPPHGGFDYFGEAGSGHYVKMVHNAIEYGMMQSLAEGYQILRQGPFDNIDSAKAGAVWQKASVIEGTLNRLATEIMSEDPTLEGTSGYVAESGEARWTLEAAQQAGVNLPVIKTALSVRTRSAQGETSYATKVLAELRNKFGGHKLNKDG